MGDDPAAPGGGKGLGVRGLMVVGRVRVGDQQGRPADRRELGHGRGAGAADRQMRPRQTLRHIGEETVDLGGDAGLGIGLGDGGEIFAARLLAHPEDRAQAGRQRGQSGRHDRAQNVGTLAAAEDQQFDRPPGNGGR